MIYEENVNKNAYEIALTLSSLCDNGTTVSALSKDEIIQGLARDFVQREAEAFTSAYKMAYGNLLNFKWHLNNHLIVRGLIPAPEVKNYYCHDFRYAADTCVANKCTIQCEDCAKVNSPSNEQK